MAPEETDVCAILRDQFKTHVFSDLDSVEGSKIIVWHAEALRRTDLVIGAREFAEHQVQRHVRLPDGLAPGDSFAVDQAQHAFFVVPPTAAALHLMRRVVASKKLGIAYHVRVLTRVPSHVSEPLLTDKAVENKVRSFDSWPFYWYPEFGDLVLNAFPASPCSFFLADDLELSFLCANAVASLGHIPVIRFAGSEAKQVVNTLSALSQTKRSGGFFDELVIVDRTLDPLTPFLEQNSFAGVLDQLFGINIKGFIKVPVDVLNRKTLVVDPDDSKAEIKLGTEVYADIVHLPLSDAVSKIRSIFKDLSGIEKAHGELSSVNDFKKYMPALQKLAKSKELAGEALHLLSIAYCNQAQLAYRDYLSQERGCLSGDLSANATMNMVERLLVEGENESDALKALRLIVVQSLSQGGISAKVLNDYEKLLIQAFGPTAAKWALNLRHLGLIQSNQGSNKFTELSQDLKKLRAVIETEKDSKAAFYSGYVPLLVRHLERGLRDQWRHFESAGSGPSITISNPRRALFVLGGLTRAEVGCLRSLEPPFTAIFTTDVLEPNRLIQSCNTRN